MDEDWNCWKNKGVKFSDSKTRFVKGSNLRFHLFRGKCQAPSTRKSLRKRKTRNRRTQSLVVETANMSTHRPSDATGLPRNESAAPCRKSGKRTHNRLPICTRWRSARMTSGKLEVSHSFHGVEHGRYRLPPEMRFARNNLETIPRSIICSEDSHLHQN